MKRMVAALILAACPVIAYSVEKSAKVVRVGLCWSGYNAVIAMMDNGDSLTLGNLADDLTKARLSIALAAKATGESVFYQIPSTETVCQTTRGTVEWWVAGGSVY